jgi:endonuclease/exonuclease/phosphatase family metal-dependent hydrolase
VFFRKWYFLVSLLALIFLYSDITTIFPIQFEKNEVVSAENSLKVLSYNTMLSALLVKQVGNKQNPILEYIVNENADVVCLQEFAVSPNKDFLTYEDVSKALNKQYPYSQITFKNKNEWSEVGLATFSKFPIVKKGAVHFDSDYNLCHYCDIDINDQIVRFINVHLESNRLTSGEKAMPMELKNDFNTEKLSGATKYLSRKLGLAYKVRAIQADSISALVRKSTMNIILCGDFNDVPLSYAYTKISDDLKDTFVESGSGFGWTFNESLYHFRIDYIMCSEDFMPTSFKIVKLKDSDHFPIVSEINLNTLNK